MSSIEAEANNFLHAFDTGNTSVKEESYNNMQDMINSQIFESNDAVQETNGNNSTPQTEQKQE